MLAFKVSALEVDQCADELVRQRVHLLSPPTGQVFDTPNIRNRSGNDGAWARLIAF
jgi:hypothetical protein